MKEKSLYYKESGHIGAMGPVIMLLVGIIASGVLAGIYGFAMFYIPFVYLNFILTVLFGACIGMVVGNSGVAAKVRNRKLMLLFGALFGLIAAYFSWIAWLFAASEMNYLVYEPLEIFTVLLEASKVGIWSLFGSIVKGGFLWSIWIMEALIIITAATYTAYYTIRNRPFCESCNEWLTSTTLTSRLQAIHNHNELVLALENYNIEELTKLNVCHPDDLIRAKVTLHHCNSCQELSCLSVDELLLSVNEKGEVNQKEKAIVENLIINNSILLQLKQWCSSFI